MARPSTKRTPPRIVSPQTVRRGSPVQFFQETISELRKAVWPTRQETVRLTYIVLLIAAAVAAFLGVLDYSLTQTLTRFVIR